MPFVLNKINHPYYLFSCHLIFRFETNTDYIAILLVLLCLLFLCFFFSFFNFIARTLFIELFIVIEGNVYLYRTSSASSQLDSNVYRPFWWNSNNKNRRSINELTLLIHTVYTMGNGKGTTQQSAVVKNAVKMIDVIKTKTSFLGIIVIMDCLPWARCHFLSHSIFSSFSLSFFFPFSIHLPFIVMSLMRASLTTFQLEHSTAFESLKHVIAIIICVPITSVIVWCVFDKYDFDWIETCPPLQHTYCQMVYGHLLENGSHQRRRRRRHQKHQHRTKPKKRVHDYLPRHYSMHRHGCHNGWKEFQWEPMLVNHESWTAIQLDERSFSRTVCVYFLFFFFKICAALAFI